MIRQGKFAAALLVGLVFAGSYLARSLLPRTLHGNASQTTARAADYRRIVSLAPSITETLFALGLGERVVGVTRYCTYPPEVREKAKVGGFLDPNLEGIVALHPDLVVMLQEHDQAIPGLRELGLNRLVVSHKSLEGILESIGTIGDRCHRATEAKALVARLRLRMDAVQRAAASLPPTRVMLCIDRTRGTGGITDCYVAGPDGYLNRLITMAGGQNVFADEQVPFPVVSSEGILHANPEVIVELASWQADDVETLRNDWNSLSGVEAVRTGQVHVFTDDFAPIPGPRFVLLLERLHETFKAWAKAHSTKQREKPMQTPVRL